MVWKWSVNLKKTSYRLFSDTAISSEATLVQVGTSKHLPTSWGTPRWVVFDLLLRSLRKRPGSHDLLIRDSSSTGTKWSLTDCVLSRVLWERGSSTFCLTSPHYQRAKSIILWIRFSSDIAGSRAADCKNVMSKWCRARAAELHICCIPSSVCSCSGHWEHFEPILVAHDAVVSLVCIASCTFKFSIQ